MTKNFLGFLVLCVSTPLFASVKYFIDINDPAHHTAQVKMIIPAGMESIDVLLPTWRTGNYKLINQANGIRNFKATSKVGKNLNWQRKNKSHWVIENPTEKAITVSYQLYANELAFRSRHIDSTHAYLDATAVFMYVPQLMLSEHQINLEVDDNWRSFSGLKETGKHQFVAKNYHQLSSSPIETGINKLSEFSVDGRDYQIVIWGEGNYSLEKITKDLKALVKQGSTIWSNYPFEKYVFIIHATSGARGATEHLNSTVIQRERNTFAPRKEYLKFLRTASHEFVHTWNVKAYRPESLVPYDYQKENYSQLLWVAEGSTSYLQDHLLLTGKIQKPKEYFKELAERIDRLQQGPGFKMQSVADSSFEKWIAQGGDFATNHSSNIYSHGFMVSWLLDAKILEDSNLKYSYKDVHNALYEKRKEHSTSYDNFFAAPFNQQDILSIAKQLTGNDYQAWWQKNVLTPFSIDFKVLLDKAGLKFKTDKKKEINVWTGFKSKNEKGFLALTSVEKGSPAWQSGLTTKDLLVAIDGMRVTHENFKMMMEKYAPTREIEVSFFRNDQLMKTQLKLGKRPKKPLEIGLVDNPTDAQKKYFKAWLGIDYPKPDKELLQN
ncbi:M61 family metallopeptidase [Aliikangiella marina]|uniref:M61 family metallopeptidase n=2 Tax=Aliikangiella marina TaxID=1712262 RepID=A0A545T1P0_9GAMM|nr:M61 family metallopeptidase [Aliikangiella marina]